MLPNIPKECLKYLPNHLDDGKEMRNKLRSMDAKTLYDFIGCVIKEYNSYKKELPISSFSHLGIQIEKTDSPELVLLMKISKHNMTPSLFNKMVEPIIKMGNTAKQRIPCEEFMRKHYLLLKKSPNGVSYILSERLDTILSDYAEDVKNTELTPYETVKFKGRRKRNQVTLAMKEEFANVCQMEKLFIGDVQIKEIFITAANQTKADVCYSTSPFGVLDFHFELEGLTTSDLYREVFREFVSEQGEVTQRDIDKKVMSTYGIEHFEHKGKSYYYKLYAL